MNAFLWLLCLNNCQNTEDVLTAESSDLAIFETQAKIDGYLNIDLQNLPVYSSISLPAHYDVRALALDNSPGSNRLSDLGVTLGRVLFYDRQLSVNDSVACASCHTPATGFSDSNTLSNGFSGGLTGSHSMRLANARYFRAGTMFWNKRASTLEEQVTMPIKDPVEMGFDEANGGFNALIQKMNASPYYPALFSLVFGDSNISEAQVQKSLAQFVRSMVSYRSRFDSGYANAYRASLPDRGLSGDFNNFTVQENLGKTLFLNPRDRGGAGCAACHLPPTFALHERSRSNGLDAGESTAFKSPSLKNVAVTGPYMHDGRFDTLEEVVEHYNSGIKEGPALDNQLRQASGVQKLGLNETEKTALVAFMKTLTDEEFMIEAKFHTPFKSNP